jgi:hypothetical protein
VAGAELWRDSLGLPRWDLVDAIRVAVCGTSIVTIIGTVIHK